MYSNVSTTAGVSNTTNLHNLISTTKNLLQYILIILLYPIAILNNKLNRGVEITTNATKALFESNLPGIIKVLIGTGVMSVSFGLFLMVCGLFL